MKMMEGSRGPGLGALGSDDTGSGSESIHMVFMVKIQNQRVFC
jgi:hypothetical protein